MSDSIIIEDTIAIVIKTNILILIISRNLKSKILIEK